MTGWIVAGCLYLLGMVLTDFSWPHWKLSALIHDAPKNIKDGFDKPVYLWVTKLGWPLIALYFALPTSPRGPGKEQNTR